ncbi:mandelate racemase/muconate lactonizing enzyme family protein [Aureimonas phyllosphaerae]|uniref:Galactonate dehydratase n=1 Tax=Aureimonas phyllosphaerae TaxID=1166078 RepID=A0A7W6FW95_9HYPH|nr:mandelate racemase/muconate lactonizing enzyme family protein [Aureimonas phyllosphaerae]MBB3937966.1 galactonate dehydratase [Aureimonas phyllosphaerae]MBB3961989.1 galactonate dehydratase [Aureimonas phyllosphaerae]SFF52727.1 galactonate dehydratase [Aureimonas phyllosphaerae]
MKITAVRTFPVWIGDRNQLLVKVETDAGISGWGESGLSSRELAVAAAIRHYAEFLVGQDARRIGRLWQEMYRSQYFEGGRVLTAAISAIDIALHDIKGKALGVPVHKLLGGRQRDLVPTFGCVRADDPDALIAASRRAIDAGWEALRLGWRSDERSPYEPREHIAEIADWLISARWELGDRVVLGVDYHHRLSVAEAASFCQRLPDGTLDFLEEPIRDETPQAYAALRRMTRVPFAIGEEFSSKWQFMPYVEGGFMQYARLDICNVGGFTEAMKVAGWCEAHYIDVMPHNPLGPICTAATVHLCAAIPNMSYLECWETPGEDNSARQDSPVFRSRLRLQGASFPVPDAPGLGIEIDEEALADAEPFRFSEMPHLVRKDGSVTNW